MIDSSSHIDSTKKSLYPLSVTTFECSSSLLCLLEKNKDNFGNVIWPSIKSKKLINEGSVPYIMPQERSIDLDENFQLELAKKIIRYEKI